MKLMDARSQEIIQNNKQTDMEEMVCLVIDYVMNNMGLASIEHLNERTEIYRQVGTDLLSLAKGMDAEQSHGVYGE